MNASVFSTRPTALLMSQPAITLPPGEMCVYCDEPIGKWNDFRIAENGHAHRYCGRGDLG